jgi:rare lipoprotein A
MNAAMNDVPIGTKVSVTSLDDPSKSIEVTITDTGPHAKGRIIDRTPKAFQTLFGSTKKGVGNVIVLAPAGGQPNNHD